MKAPERIERAAQRRIAGVQAQIETAVRLAERGVPLAAEPVQERVVARVQQKTRLPKPQAELIARSLSAARADREATVAEIEAATGIDFGDVVRDADIHAGAEARQISAFEQAFVPKKPARRGRRGASRR